MMRTFVVTAALSSALLAQQAEKVVPVHQEPRHHLVFETPGTRILDVKITPGDTTLFHTHSDPILYINLNSAQTRSQTLGREWSGEGAAAGTKPPQTAAAAAAPPRAPVNPRRMYSVTSYATEPLTHRVNNYGSTLFRLIGITNASAGDESTAASADFAATPEVDNRWFRAYRWTANAETATAHRHVNPVAIVLIAGSGAVSAEKDTALTSPGDFVYVDANAPHRLRTTGAAEIAEIEIRRPRS
jgi:quercetin dioxygenase-like cupin family protein